MENAFDFNKEFFLKDLPDEIEGYIAFSSSHQEIENGQLSNSWTGYSIFPSLNKAISKIATGYLSPLEVLKTRYDRCAYVTAKKADLITKDDNSPFKYSEVFFKTLSVVKIYDYEKAIELYMQSEYVEKDSSVFSIVTSGTESMPIEVIGGRGIGVHSAENSISVGKTDSSIAAALSSYANVLHDGNKGAAVAIGEYTKITTSGKNATAVTLGVKSHININGDYSLAVAMGNDSNVTATGKNCVVVSTNSRMKGCAGTLFIHIDRIQRDGQDYLGSVNIEIVDPADEIQPDLFYSVKSNGYFLKEE